MTAVPEVGNKRVKFKVTILSQPAALVKVCVAVLLLVEYVFPSIQVIGVQDVIVAVPALGNKRVKFKVTTLSHPAALVKVNVGILVLEV
jgi:hypothetical protein